MVDGDKLRDMIRYTIKCCYRYYVLAHPIDSDQTYDQMLHALTYYEDRAAETSTVGPSNISPTQMIWGDCADQYPSWATEEPTGQERESAYDILSVYTEGL
ncbi:MAG: hypothetical protein GY832_31745 [Chloroflexi bacterium]|nr:hypothetical protein [Chloroflexota bacterium]